MSSEDHVLDIRGEMEGYRRREDESDRDYIFRILTTFGYSEYMEYAIKQTDIEMEAEESYDYWTR